MNHIINDRNECVIAEGSPGSYTRLKTQYPKLIDRLNGLYWSAYDSPGALLLLASNYGQESVNSVIGLVLRITQDNNVLEIAKQRAEGIIE